MLMIEQMILTVFIIPVTAGTETELQIGIILIGTPADGAFVAGDPVPHPALVDRFAE